MASFASLSPELLEHVLARALEGPVRLDQRNLARFASVSPAFAAASRRLLLRWVTVDNPQLGAKLLDTLHSSPACGACVRSLVVKADAFDEPKTFSELSQDDLLRLSVNLVAFDSARAAFAPLADGRKPLPAFPKTLTSMRLGQACTSPAEGYYTDSDEDDDADDDLAVNRDEQRAAKISATYLSLLRAYPRTLTSLKLSKLAGNALPLFPPVAPLDLPHLATLELDMVTVPSGVFKWLTATARDLESLKVWMATGVTEADLLDFAQRKGRSLKQFAFKPKGKQGKKLANEMVLYMSTLEKLTLGDKACDHGIWPNLPSSLTHVCVSIPANVQDARLPTVAHEVTTRLTNLLRLELFSGLYFPPPVEVVYPPTDPLNPLDGGLRELRLSHISSPTLEAFLLRLGGGLYTLALHHITVAMTQLTPYCPRLRRLELGAAGVLTADLPQSVLSSSSVHAASLTFLRVHLASHVALEHLTASIGTIRATQHLEGDHHRLQTLELVGHFPGNLVGEGWTSGKGIDGLVEACEREQVRLCVNGRPVDSVGDLWGAMQGQTGRETL
ncbi:hypothetical protein JCM9279_007659 [Rhodotorula babjevae]